MVLNILRFSYPTTMFTRSICLEMFLFSRISNHQCQSTSNPRLGSSANRVSRKTLASKDLTSLRQFHVETLVLWSAFSPWSSRLLDPRNQNNAFQTLAFSNDLSPPFFKHLKAKVVVCGQARASSQSIS